MALRSNSLALLICCVLSVTIVLGAMFASYPGPRDTSYAQLPPTSLDTVSLTAPNSPPANQAEIQAAPTESSEPWGVAEQLDEHTWTMRVGEDELMATPGEIYAALNNYRVQSGSSYLEWDDRLAEYATTRAQYFTNIQGLDGHAGFDDFLQNQDGFSQLGYGHLGENSSYGYRLDGVHLIEWIYAGDQPHDDNQLNPAWTRVGVGVDGSSTNLIFAK